MTRHVTLQEVADNYQLSIRTLRRYIASGRLTAVRVGPKLIRLDPAQVEKELGAH
ncbi:helix-turn-helix domain-containing protein [Mycobacterium intracellulare]|uniref:helix-turn-helix domain-containing protein n=1 Tax=Mycobacterium intracellulare TaxID=1767 RepID=UPI000A986333|nr:helix-turn-helix domain-containing protein [Mycobacterium intracellulare]